MVDYDKDLGDNLYNLLIAIQDAGSATVDDMMGKLGAKNRRFLTADFRELLIRRYLTCLQGEPDIDFSSAKSMLKIPGLTFCVSSNGLNYLQLRRKWWQRFWVRSIACPVAVSFVTALNADTIWAVGTRAVLFICKMLPAAQP